MNYTLENFISYCDNMMIVEEGFKDTVKNSRIGKAIKAAIDWIIKHIKIIGQRIKDAWKVLTGRATIVDKNDETVEKLKRELSDLKRSKLNTESDLSHALNRIESLNKTINDLKENIAKLTNDRVDDSLKYERTIEKLRSELDVLQKARDGDKALLKIHNESRDRESLVYRNQIKELRNKIKDMIEDMEEKRSKDLIMMSNRAKESLRGSDLIEDTRGFVEPTLKAYPIAARLIGDVTNLVKYANIELTTGKETLLTTNPSVISDLEEKVNDCYAVCKSIYRHDDKSGDVPNPKKYSKNVIEDFYFGMDETYKKLVRIYEDVSKLNSKIDNPNPNIVRVLNIACKLISVLESYTSIIFRLIRGPYHLKRTPMYDIAERSGHERNNSQVGRKREKY